MTAFALLFTLSAIGISETVYLIRTRRAHEHPVCPIGEGCEVVLESKYNHIFLIRNDVLGLFAYIALAFITAFLVIGIEPMYFWNSSMKIIVGIASFVSIFFTYLQAKVIRAWCFWCVMSACTIWLMGFIIIFSSLI
jgi:uncharacterized membrane protein